MTTIVMALEGVLSDNPATDSMLNYDVTDTGRAIFNLLKSSARIVLLAADPYEDRVKSWLARERIAGYAMVYTKPADSPLTPSQWRISKMTDLSGIGHHISYYVDTDPATIQGAMEVGIDGLLLAVPSKYPGQDKGFEKSDKPTPWCTLVERVDAQNAIRAARAQQESEKNAPT